jgi:hypothetical protein
MAARNCSHLLSQLSICFTEESTVFQICSVNVLGSRGRKASGAPDDLIGAWRPVPMDSNMSGWREPTSDQMS